MAAPVDAGRATTNITAAASPWTVNLPGSIASGDLLVMYIQTANGRSVAATGWTQLVEDATDGSGDNHIVLYRVADGTEGATESVAPQGGTSKGGAIVWRVTGAKTTGTILTSATVVNQNANIDPPNAATDGGASADVLSIVMAGVDGETQTFSAAPASYSNLQTANSGTGGAAATNCVIAGATRQRTAVTAENPGAFTNDAPQTANGGTAYTVLAHAAAGGSSTPQALTATSTTTATISRSVGKSLSATGTSTASIRKSVGKAVTGTVTSAASIRKSVGKILSATVTSTATMLAQRAVLLTISATSTVTATISKQIAKPLSASVTSTATIAKQVGKSLTANATVSATLSAIRAVLVTMTATVSSTATMTRQVGLHVSATVTSSASVVKQVTHQLTATVTSTATIAASRAYLRTLQANATVSATMTRSIGTTLTATATVTASMIRQVGKTLAGTVTTTATLAGLFHSGAEVIKACVSVTFRPFAAIAASVRPQSVADVDETTEAVVSVDVIECD